MKPDRCPTCRRLRKRSTPANKRYWALVGVVSVNVWPLGEFYTVKQWHKQFREKFLGYVETKLPSGKVLQELCSTADLDVAEFNDYMTKVEVFANERGAYLEDSGWEDAA